MTDYPKNVKTREGIITNMCYTWRHDFGAPFQSWPEVFGLNAELPPGITTKGMGMTEEERAYLWKQMAQLFDNDIAPFMEFKK